MIQAIIAMQPDGIMGSTKTSSGLPWPNIAIDMNNFKVVTKGSNVIVGRNTYEAMPKLRGRITHVITGRAENYKEPFDPGVYFWESVELCFGHLLNQMIEVPIYIIGGPTLLHTTLKYVQRIHLSVIHTDYPGDILAPKVKDYGFTNVKALETHIDPSTRVRVDFYELTR